jgi:hypothetical protein
MPVVINELEVVVESEEAAGSGRPAPSGPPPLTPLEIAELLERRARGELRLYAH